MIFIFMVLCLTTNLFAQKYTNNRQYIINPYSAIYDYKNTFDAEHVISFKTNILHFHNNQGKYNVNFIFKKNLLDQNSSVELFIRVCSQYHLAPFDNYNQNVKLIITDGTTLPQWISYASFNKREAFVNVLRDGNTQLTIRKKLSHDDFIAIKTIFEYQRGISMFLFTLEGQFALTLPQDIAKIYTTLFNYKQSMGWGGVGYIGS